MTFLGYASALSAIFLLFAYLRSQRKLRTLEAQAYRAQNQLRGREDASTESHDRETQRLLDALPHPFISISEQGRIIRINRHAAEILSGRSTIGRSFRQIILDAPLVDAIAESLENKSTLSEILRLSPNSPFSSEGGGKESHWEVDLRPISLRDNTLEIQLMMRDLTTGVHADQVRQDFVANASHELRTPLSIISGYLENLTEEGGLDNKKIAKKMLATMDRHVDRINRIVEDMLVISKLESEDGVPLKIAPFNLAVCVRDVIERLELVIGKQDARVKVKVPEITVEGDLFYWTQVLFNLVENALKQNANSSLTIRIEARQSDNETVITITDDGLGIPSADLPFIFKRFYRVEKHHSQTQIKGTGLGLSIVKRAIEAHNGTITATSTPGVETTFTIRLPHAPRAEGS